MRRLYLTLPVLSLLTVLTLAGCRTEPAVAAYVGDRTITTDQLSAAVKNRMADPNIAAVVEPGEAQYQRFVLGLLIKEVEYRIIGDAYGVSVTDREVQVKLDELLADDDADQVAALYAQLAVDQRVSELDVRDNVRQALIREGVAVEEELDGPIQEPALRQRYEEQKDQLSTIQLGLVTVPDQETAESTLAELVADPSIYPALATNYVGPDTLPALTSSPVTDIPAELLPSVTQTEVGQGFTVVLPNVIGVVVGYVASLDVPTFEEARDQIRAEAASGVDAAAGEVVNEFISGLDIDVNPRYGSLDQGQIVPATDGGVVQILKDQVGSAPGP